MVRPVAEWSDRRGYRTDTANRTAYESLGDKGDRHLEDSEPVPFFAQALKQRDKLIN